MESAIVTGATSFLGIALINYMKRAGITAYAVVRPNSCRLQEIPKGENISVIECELSELDTLPTIPKKTDAFFHIGWSSDFSDPRSNEEGQFLNVKYAEKAMHLAERCGCHTFLGVGSQAECGLVNGCITSDTPPSPLTAYAKAKIAAYHSLAEMSQKSGMKLCWPRLLSAYGPYDRPHTLIMSCIRAALSGQEIALTPATQIWDYIYVDDAAEALFRIAEYGKPMRHYPIGSGIGGSLRSYVECIAEITNNYNLLKGIGAKQYSENQVMNLLADIGDLKKDTGFSCHTDFCEGIKKTINFVKNQNEILAP